MASRRLPGPFDGLRAVQKGHFLEKMAFLNDEIGLKTPPDKRKTLLFFTMLL
jgi:hypothetical protein